VREDRQVEENKNEEDSGYGKDEYKPEDEKK